MFQGPKDQKENGLTESNLNNQVQLFSPDELKNAIYRYYEYLTEIRDLTKKSDDVDLLHQLTRKNLSNKYSAHYRTHTTTRNRNKLTSHKLTLTYYEKQTYEKPMNSKNLFILKLLPILRLLPILSSKQNADFVFERVYFLFDFRF